MAEKAVLIVEDDEAVRRSLSLYLKHKGHQVETAEDGVVGLNNIRAKDYSVVVTDVMMPNMNGMELLEQIKQVRPYTQVIMVTGYADLQVAIEAMKKGASDFITKPFRYDQVDKLIRDLQERGAEPVVDTAKSTAVDSRLERKVHELSILYSISEVLDNISSEDDLFQNMVDLSLKITEAAGAFFYLFDHELDLYYLRGNSGEGDAERPTMFKLDPAIAENMYIQRVPLLFNSPDDLGFWDLARPADYDVRSLLLAPFFVRGQNFGLLTVENKRDSDFTDADVTFITMLLKKASLVIENRALYETIYSNLVSTLRSLVSTIEAKDQYTQRHSERVTKISMMIGNEIKCSKEELDIIQFAGMLHDIGKIGVSDAVLQKPGRLTQEEFEAIKQHPVIGARILDPLGMLPHEKAIIRHHHERWDGRGYPDGLAGRDIPFLARIVSVADAYDAMTSDRVYRKGLSHEMAMAELERNAWFQFDGSLVQAFRDMCSRMGDLDQIKLQLE